MSEPRSSATVDGERWTAGSWGGNYRSQPFYGIIRSAGTPRVKECGVTFHAFGHKTSTEARECAKETLGRIVARRASRADAGTGAASAS